MQQEVALTASRGPSSSSTSLPSCDDEKLSMSEGQDSEGDGPLATPTPGKCSNVDDRALVRLMERTGYKIFQHNGQRRYGPPLDWNVRQPPRGCEVFVGKIPRDCFEDELVPLFERFGRIYEMRLMMDYNGMNRGYAFVVYMQPSEAKECVRGLNNWEIRKGRTLGVCMSVDNCRLFVGGIPKKVNKEDIRCEMEKVTEAVVDIIVYPSASDKSKNRGFAFIEYESHRAAAMARRKLMQGRVQLWGHQVAVDWAEPELEVPEEVMAQVKVLYVRNLMLSTTEAGIEEAFSKYAPVERVKKIRDYAFVHYHTREGALLAMKNLNGTTLDGAKIEVTLAKPVDKDNYPRGSRHVQPYSTTIPIGLVDVSQLALYPGYCQATPKYIPRNSMGARVVRTPRTTVKGRGRNVCPVAFSQQVVFPASPLQGALVPSYFQSPKRDQSLDELCLDALPGVEFSPAPGRQAAPPPAPPMTAPTTCPFIKKSPVALLEELCIKNGLGSPIYSPSSVIPREGGFAYQYQVYIPAMGTTHVAVQYCPNPEEARSLSAQVALNQIMTQLRLPLEGGGLAAATAKQPATPPHMKEAFTTFLSPPLVAVPSPAKQGCTPPTAACLPNWTETYNIYPGGYVQPTMDVIRHAF